MSIKYPELITSLPDADLNVPGVKAKLLQADDRQIVFFEFEPSGAIPPHSHGAQWGVVLDGEIELTIGGETRIYGKGDTYFVPAGVEHSVRILSPAKAMDLFADAQRYRPKA